MCLIQHPAIVGPYERFINSTNLEDFMATILSIADQAGTILQTEPKVSKIVYWVMEFNPSHPALNTQAFALCC